MSPVCLFIHLFIQQTFLSSPQGWLLQTVITLWATQRVQEQGEWEVQYSFTHQTVGTVVFQGKSFLHMKAAQVSCLQSCTWSEGGPFLNFTNV